MKKGIALFITISFIVILTGLIAYMLSFSMQSFKSVENLEVKNQSSIFYKDGKDIVDSYVKDIKTDEDFTNFLDKISFFSYSKGNSSVQVELEPLSNKININSLLLQKKVDKNLLTFIENICSKYNVLDAKFFIDLLLDTIDEDDLEREALSEISIQNIKFSNSRISNMHHFQTILEYYVKVRNDENILKVPWEKLIYFGEKRAEILDCDRMDKDLVELLGLDKESYGSCDDLSEEDYTAIKSNYRLKRFNKEDNYYILVKIQYELNSSHNKITFVYNMKTNKVSDIDLF